MFEVIGSKKPCLLFRGLIGGKLVALAPEPFALRLNASNISLPQFEQWDLNTDSGMHERCFIGGEIGEYFGALSEEFFEWDEELGAWAVSRP